jgi:hypothetical protein
MAYLVVAHKAKWGLVITHTGLLMMLAAGGITFYYGQESLLALEEGESSNVSASDRDWELALWRVDGEHAHERDVSAVSVGHGMEGHVLTAPMGGISLEIAQYVPNGRLTKEGLLPMATAKEPADNLPGLNLNVRAAGGEPEQISLWGGIDEPVEIAGADGTYALSLRHTHYPLPVAIELVDFQRVMHPGSGIARSFASQVVVRPNQGPGRRLLISMNKPLRTGGFTFYQSSYIEGEGREVSVFAVVKNYGRLVPYIATGVTVGGMILHFVGIMVIRLQRQRAREVRTA